MKQTKLTAGTKSWFIRQIQEMDLTEPKRIVFSKWTNKRTITMNAQQHIFYAEIAKWYGDRLAIEVKRACKDMFGLPILHMSAVNCETIELITSRLDYYGSDYETKMILIHGISVTSLFNTVESKRYCDDMIFYFGELGCSINYKD